MLTAAVRKALTLAEITSLAGEVEAWGTDWPGTDPRRNYATHVAALRAALSEALVPLRNEAKAVSSPDAGAAAGLLRAIEVRLGVARAVWADLQSRVEARAGGAYAGLLAAADEVVWSAHRGAMIQALRHDVIDTEPPAPLVSVSPEWGAALVPQADVQLLTRGPAEQLARRVCERLRIREIRLPHTARGQPSLLAILLHEVGHAVQMDLDLRVAFQSHVEARLGPLWGAWATEVFADACAVAAGGRAILPTLVAWEAQPDTKLRRPGTLPDSYPPPLVRWELVRAWGEHLGLPMSEHAVELPSPASLDPSVASLLDELPAVIALLDAPLPGLRNPLKIMDLWPDTPDLCADGGPVSDKRAQLGSAGAVPVDATMEGARAAVIAAVDAVEEGYTTRAESVGLDPAWDAGFAAWRKTLGERTLRVVAACRGPGARAGGDFSRAVAGAELYTWIRDTTNG